MKGDKKKGDSEESPNEKERVDEFVNEWCRLYRETSQAYNATAGYGRNRN